MDLGETTSDMLDDATSTAETVGTAAFLLRKKLGLTAEPGLATGAVLDSPKVVADLGARLSPEAWDRSIQAGFKKEGAASELAAAPKTVTAAESVVKSAPPAVTASKTVDHLGRIEPEMGSHALPRAKAAHTVHAHTEGREFSHTMENTAASKPVAAAHSAPVSAPKTTATSSKPETHTAKATSAPADIGHRSSSVSAKSLHDPHPPTSVSARPATSVSVHRAETAVANLAAKESASVALKGVMRAVVGPEVAIAAAVISAVPDAYHFVDNASGHAISKSSVGQGMSRLAEHSGANAAAHKIGGLVDSASESLGRVAAKAMAKTGADKALEKASELVGRAGEASGVFAGFAKVGELWDAGAAKLEKTIHDNVHGPDNPAHKATPAVAHAAAASHHSAAAPAVKAAASAVAGGPHAADAAKHAVHPASHAEKAAKTPAQAVAHKAAEAPHAPHAPHAPSSHSTAAHQKPSGHGAGHAAHHHAASVAPVAAVAVAAATSATPALAAPETGTSPLIAANHAKVPSAFLQGDPGTALLGSAGLSKALEGHMDTHGMGAEAKVLADPMARSLANFLADSPNSGTYLVINPNNDAIATMTGPGATTPAAGDLPTIQSKTLEHVAESGISPAGVSELRESLPSEAKGKSDLELADIVGVIAISKIAENGLDVQAVDKMQDHIVKSTEGTEFQVAPDRLSTVKVLHDMGETGNKDFAVIESSAAGTRLIGAMSESEFAAHPGKPGADLVALDVSGLRKELSLPDSTQASTAEAGKGFSAIPSLADMAAGTAAPAAQAQQQKAEAPAPEPAMER